MDKRKQANLRVKKAITDSLFELMQKDSLNDITITDIITNAQVARASFYRNYTSKEDILITLVRDVLDEFRENADYDLSDYCSFRNIRRSFLYFQNYKHYILDLYRSGFGSMLLEELNQFHESTAGIMPADSPERYQLYIYIGALYNTALTWLQEDDPKPVDDVVKIMQKYLYTTDCSRK